ncbi:MAG TPA: hypothetical protein VJ249_05525 [Candidatus Bathyarchaeia archaeon]|nr:hypothetical protein [Candidatus Bathyarchaeia archaeon]
MFRKPSEVKTLILLTTIIISAFAYVSLAYFIPKAEAASYTSAAKPMEFYLHYVDAPVDVAGIQTKYIMNSTQWFRFLTQQDAYTNSFYKPVGQPKVAVDFYLYPNLAGPVIFNGTWQVFIWANSSAYKPTGFTLQFYEITVGGATLWDSGAQNPTVTSSIGEYIDVPVYSYNLSTPLTHAFNAGTSLQVHVEVNTGSSADTRIWYGSPFYPSKVILPAQDYARPVSVKTYAYDNSETNMFYYNWSDSQRIVTVRANVTDPFGGYDIYRVNMTILDPAQSPVVDNVDLVRMSDGQWLTRFANTYEANWTYPSTAQLGNYTVNVSVIDNNGYYRYQDIGSFGPFIEYNDHMFQMGVIVYYNPAFHIVDDVDSFLPNAQVYVTWPNSTRDMLPRYTDANGWVNLTHVLPANYGLTILWKDVVVKQTTVYVNSDGPFAIKTEVYQLTINVLGNNGAPVHGAYVIVFTQTGVGYGLDTTNAAGQAMFKLPKGTYNTEAHYSGEYWLKVVATSAAEPAISVESSTSTTIVLEEFPPPIWTTTGFLLLMALVAVSMFAATYIVFLSRKRVPAVRRRA